MTPDQKIANVEAQIDDLMRSRQLGLKGYNLKPIQCPYCEAENHEGAIFCCIPFGRAVAAILLRKDLQEKAEQAERIAEKVGQN